MKTPCALLALALAAGPLSGCYAARRMFVLEASVRARGETGRSGKLT